MAVEPVRAALKKRVARAMASSGRSAAVVGGAEQSGGEIGACEGFLVTEDDTAGGMEAGGVIESMFCIACPPKRSKADRST
jgi:hypothetical protein